MKFENDFTRDLTNQYSGRDERETGVLHAPVREGGGQDQDVILTPHVWPREVLRRLQHGLGLIKRTHRQMTVVRRSV